MTLHLRILSLLIMSGLATGSANAADNGSGHFRKGEYGVDVRHAIAVLRERSLVPAEDEILVYLSDRPLDAMKAAATFDPDDSVREQYSGRSGGYVQVCITAAGGECGLFYLHRDPSDSFNTSGYGELKLDTQTRERIAGRWVLREPEDFFGETYDYDLRFDVAVVTPPGASLPAGGGEPGKAYRAYADAVAKGDLAALRRMLGESARWRMPDDDDSRSKDTLKELRNEQPLQPKILRGRIDGDQAVLWVEGVDRDDIRQRGRVLMRRDGNGWTFVEADLDSVQSSVGE
jgi:hypothetical protein